MDEILSHDEQTGVDTLTNEGYDIVFDHVAFSYNQKKKYYQMYHLSQNKEKSQH